jgi:hypothetical protein
VKNYILGALKNPVRSEEQVEGQGGQPRDKNLAQG